MALFSSFLLILGIGVTVYAIIKKDFSSALLGFGIMLYALISVLAIIRVVRKNLHLLKVKAERAHLPKKNLFGSIFSGSKSWIAFLFFFVFGLAACWYYWYVERDLVLLGISALVSLIALILIAKVMKKSGIKIKLPFKRKVTEVSVREGKGTQEKKAEKKEEKIEAIKSSDIDKLKKVVKEKMDALDRGKTPLDVLYWLLVEKKQLKLQEISKIFSIDIKKAEEWAKILELHELAEMIYPAFGTPVLKIKKPPV